MIRDEKVEAAWEALRSILLQAKCQAYESGNRSLGDLLNDAELLPEYFADRDDRTVEFREILAGIVQINPALSHVLENYERATVEA